MQREAEARNPLPLAQVREFVTQGLKTSLFRRGNRSVSLQSVDGALRFDLTSDRQIGLTAWNGRLAADVAADWREKGYRCYEADRHTWYQLTGTTGRFWME